MFYVKYILLNRADFKTGDMSIHLDGELLHKVTYIISYRLFNIYDY